VHQVGYLQRLYRIMFLTGSLCFLLTVIASVKVLYSVQIKCIILSKGRETVWQSDRSHEVREW